MTSFGETLDMIIEEALRRLPEDRGIEWFLDRVLESANMPSVRARYISSSLAAREHQLIEKTQRQTIYMGHEPERVYCDHEYGLNYCGICHKKVIRNQSRWTHSTE